MHELPELLKLRRKPLAQASSPLQNTILMLNPKHVAILLRQGLHFQLGLLEGLHRRVLVGLLLSCLLPVVPCHPVLQPQDLKGRVVFRLNVSRLVLELRRAERRA